MGSQLIHLGELEGFPDPYFDKKAARIVFNTREAGMLMGYNRCGYAFDSVLRKAAAGTVVDDDVLVLEGSAFESFREEFGELDAFSYWMPSAYVARFVTIEALVSMLHVCRKRGRHALLGAWRTALSFAETRAAALGLTGDEQLELDTDADMPTSVPVETKNQASKQFDDEGAIESTATVVFGQHAIVVVRIKGKRYYFASQVSDAVGYADRKQIAKNVRGSWANEFKIGRDYVTVRGNAFKALKSAVANALAPGANAVSLLTHRGAELAAIKAKTAMGESFRAWIVDDVLPSAMADSNPPTEALAPVHEPPQVVKPAPPATATTTAVDAKWAVATLMELRRAMPDVLDDSAVASFVIDRIGIVAGVDTRYLKPPIDKGWTASSIAASSGVSATRVGLIASRLNLKEAPFSFQRLVEVDLPSGKKIARVQYVYGAGAVERIKAEIALHPEWRAN